MIVRRAVLCPVVLLLMAGCSDSSGPETREPAAIAVVSGSGQTGRVAEVLPAPLVVRVTDAAGRPVQDATVTFAVIGGGGSVTPSTAATSSDGVAETQWTLGTRTMDTQTARASVTTATGARTITFTATPAPAAAARLVVFAGNNQNRTPGTALRDSIAALVTDAYDNPVAGVLVNWSVTEGGGTIAPTSSVSDANGVARAAWTLGPGLGAHAAEAALAGVATASFVASAVPGPEISTVAPDLLVPGATATITGSNFSTSGDNAVDFAGTGAQILQASANSLTVVVPCILSGAVDIRVVANGIPVQVTHPVVPVQTVQLEVGTSLFLPAGTVCGEVAGGGRYVLAVANGNLGGGNASLRLRGAGPATLGATRATPPGALASSTGGPRLTELPELRHHRAHRRMLEQNVELVRRLGPPVRGLRPDIDAAAAGLGAARIAVNDTLTLKIPNANSNLCSTQASVRARVVFAGNRGVILEDINAPLAGKTDSLFRALGDEFERVQWPILINNFGDPLAYDAQTDANGLIYMLFSRVINDFGGLAGFVSSGNFYSPAQCAASNQAEIFYGVVPTDSTGGYGNGTANTRENWNRTVRSLLIHEVKHIAGFAERFARNGSSSPNLEENWLEESTAVAAEELFARTVFGYAQNQNTAFQESLFCERRPNNATFPECRHKPFIMYGYYAYLYDYLAEIEGRTPTGSSGTDDYSFYGSGWFLLRWAADQFAGDEASFFKALVQDGTRRGAANLEARTGRSFTELLADWALAIAIDDRPGLGNLPMLHTVPSWNTRDIFTRMNQELPTAFPESHPLSPRLLDYGPFDVQIPSLRARTAAVFELDGAAGGNQLLHMTDGTGTGAPDPAVRLKLVRIE